MEMFAGPRVASSLKTLCADFRVRSYVLVLGVYVHSSPGGPKEVVQVAALQFIDSCSCEGVGARLVSFSHERQQSLNRSGMMRSCPGVEIGGKLLN